jgi:hypothetical protein
VRSLEAGPQVLVQPGIEPEYVFIEGLELCPRKEVLVQLQRPLARFVEAYVHPCAHSCKDSSAKRFCLRGTQGHDGLACHVGNDLVPELAASASAANAQLLYPHPNGCLSLHYGHVVAYTKGHSFHNGPHYVPALVLAQEAEQNAACIRIPDRRPLSSNVRQVDQPIGSRRRLGRLLDELIVLVEPHLACKGRF